MLSPENQTQKSERPAGGTVYGLVRGHALGETLIAAVMLGAFVVGIAYIGKIAEARLKRK